MIKVLFISLVSCFGFITHAADQVTCTLNYVETVEGVNKIINPFTTHLAIDKYDGHRLGKNVADGTTLLTVVFIPKIKGSGTLKLTHLNQPTGQKNVSMLTMMTGTQYSFSHKIPLQRVDGHNVHTTSITCALEVK